jgi:hypothetical protein
MGTQRRICLLWCTPLSSSRYNYVINVIALHVPNYANLLLSGSHDIEVDELARSAASWADTQPSAPTALAELAGNDVDDVALLIADINFLEQRAWVSTTHTRLRTRIYRSTCKAA